MKNVESVVIQFPGTKRENGRNIKQNQNGNIICNSPHVNSRVHYNRSRNGGFAFYELERRMVE